MRRFLLLIVIALLLLLGPGAYRYLTFYGLPGDGVDGAPEFDPRDVPSVPTPAASPFTDSPQVGEGFVLLDEAHGNDFSADEIATLDARLAARGYELLPYNGGDLAAALRPATAFIVIAPLESFSRAQVRAVADYVERGGHLLLIGDPTRFAVTFEETEFSFSVDIDNDDLPLNSLANEFGIIFRGDYLYNTTADENEGNYRNIILRREALGEDELVSGLETIVFYGSHSLEVGAGGEALLTAGENTWSSQTERAGALTLAALAGEGRVLALGDLTFLTDPYNRVYDNANFIAHIADFLVEPEREYLLADFPYFFDDPIDLIYLGEPALGPDAFDEIRELQQALSVVGRELRLTSTARSGHDILYLGLYSQGEDVGDLLEGAGISMVFEPPLETGEEEVTAEEDKESESSGAAADAEDEDDDALIRQIESPLGKVEMSGTSLLLLVQDEEQDSVIVLAASSEGLESSVQRLLENVPVSGGEVLDDCLVQETLALCPTYVDDEELETELDLGGLPEQMPESGDRDEEEDSDDSSSADEDYLDEIDAVLRGTMGLGDTREDTLEEGEAHAWTFSEGPVTATINLETDSDIDGVLELFDEDYEIVEGVDEGLSGEGEVLSNLYLAGDMMYTIVVRSFWGDAGSYTLTLEGESAEGARPDESDDAADEDEDESGGEEEISIFIYSDDDGDAAEAGDTGAEAIATVLGEINDNYSVTVWSATDDGLLEEETLGDQDLVIWASGDYRSGEEFDDDSVALSLYFFGGGKLLITGATPAFLEGPDLELALLNDVEVAEFESELFGELEPGTVFSLTEPIAAARIDAADLEEDEATTVVLLRGSQSEESGEPVAVGAEEAESEAKLFLMVAPFHYLPAEVQQTLMEGLLDWFAFE